MRYVQPVDNLDADEYARWLRAADDERTVLRILLDAGAHNSAVLHAEQATQLLLKGLLRGVGKANLARGSHALHGLADACAEHAGLSLSADDRDALMGLSRDYQPTRYPDAVVSGTPSENYGRDHAERAQDLTDATRQSVVTAWEALLEAGRAEKSGDDDGTGRP